MTWLQQFLLGYGSHEWKNRVEGIQEGGREHRGADKYIHMTQALGHSWLFYSVQRTSGQHEEFIIENVCVTVLHIESIQMGNKLS